jgi:serine/threonine-protein kinase
VVGAAALAGDPTMAMAQAEPTQIVRAQGGLQHNTASLPAIGHDPAGDPPKRHKATYALLAIGVIAVLVLLGLGGKALFGGPAAVPLAPVPKVIGLTQDVAEARLKTAGFVPKVANQPDAEVKGKVIDQSPTAGERHPRNSVVTITVSSGPGEVVVPDVTGYNLDSAQAAIKAVGLTIGKVESVDDPKVDKGKVIDTSPQANSKAQGGSAVSLRVSSGKVKVPNVVGLPSPEAQKALTDARLKFTTKFADSTQPVGTVVSETHTGETVDIDTQIVLTIAQAPKPTPTTTPPPTTAPTAPPTTATTAPAATTAP